MCVVVDCGWKQEREKSVWLGCLLLSTERVIKNWGLNLVLLLSRKDVPHRRALNAVRENPSAIFT
jgi:hypothetical protein